MSASDKKETAHIPEWMILSTDPAHAQHIKQLLNAPAEISILKNCAPPSDPAHAHTVVLDVNSTSCDPLFLLKQIRVLMPLSTLILITSEIDPVIASRAMRSGAAAYLASNELEALLPVAIERIRAGERFVSEGVMQGILHGMVDSGDAANSLPVQMLSDREMMIFQMMGKGCSLHRIARELGINIKTVSTHCHNIRSKLSISDNAELSAISKSWIDGHAGPTDPSRTTVDLGIP